MTGDRTLRQIEPLKDGDRITVVLTVQGGKLRTRNGGVVAYLGTPEARFLKNGGHAVRPAPSVVFLPGDVVVVEFAPHTTPYTYVRGTHGFLAERATPPGDEEMAEHFLAGRARLIARNGVPFATPITRRNVASLLPF